MTSKLLKSVPVDVLQRATALLRDRLDHPIPGPACSPGTMQADLKALEEILADTTPCRLAIVLDGGLVQGIVGENLPSDLGVAIIDYDTEGLDDVDLALVRQSDGSDAEAYVTLPAMDRPGIDLNSVFSSVS